MERSGKKIGKGWYWAGAIVGTIAILVALIVIFFDWNWLKPPLEARLSSLTGKQVKIDGAVSGEFAWVPHIALGRVRIADPAWTPDPKIATVDRIGLTIDLRQLLGGKLNFPEIEIAHPVLDLQRDANGKANWDIANEAKGPSDRGAMPVVGDLKIENGKVTYRDKAKNLTIVANIATVKAHGGNGDDSLTIDGQGTYRDTPFMLHLKGGSLNALRTTDKPYDIDLVSTVGKTKVTVAGTVLDPFQMKGLDVKLTAEGDNAEELYPIFGIPAPSTPPYHLAGTLDRDGHHWLFKNFNGTVGKSDLSGSLRFEPEHQRLLVAGNLVSKQLDFADLGLLVGASGSTAPGRPVSDQQRAMAKEYDQSDRVLPDATLRLDEVRDIDADVTLKGEHIEAQDLPLENVDLHLKLDNAVLRLDPLHVGVAGGLIDAVIVIDAHNNPVATDYDVRFHKFQLEQFLERAGYPQGGSGNIDGRIRLRGVGNSVRRSLGTSNGEASLVVDNGAISNLASDLLGLDVARSLGLLISGDQQIPLRCMVADFQVENGVMQPRILLLDTSATTVTGTGAVNLGAEHLDLSLKGKPKQATPIALGGPIQVNGTFKKTSFGLGAEAYARGGAAVALGALLTPLAAILGFIDPGKDRDADCLGLETEARNSAAKQPPAPAPRRMHGSSSPKR